MVPFALHQRLASDTWLLGDLPLCRLLLMNDRRFPWCVLVPRQGGLRELHELPYRDQATLMREISQVSRAVMEHCRVDKLNVGALGNVVPQLHVHVVGRRQQDEAWPGPVWGHGRALAYDDETASRLIAALRNACAIKSAR